LTYARLLEPNKPYYFENALEFLDQDGEWYLDKTQNMLYYKPGLDENIENIEIVCPLLETVIYIKGEALKPAFNLVLRNLQVKYSNWTVPNRDGIIATQAVQGKGYPGSTETGIVTAEFARNIKIENCLLSCSGNHGIVFSKGVQNSQIHYCHIDQISANGVVIDT